MPSHSAKLPWSPDQRPLMLAPMQGLTNRGLRHLFIERFHPDVVFTEYVRVQTRARGAISAADRLEVCAEGPVPLVVQLIGSDSEALVAAADTVQELGGAHLNINLGCPYGRMTGNTAGGALLANPAALAPLLAALRKAIRGSFSVKLRAGIDDPGQVLGLLDLFEDCGVDFLILHPRTVCQRYGGSADHLLTAQVVKSCRLPVIANGDIFTPARGLEVLETTNAAGLMLGRGAIADPWLFERLRGNHPAISSPAARGTELHSYLTDLLAIYQELFCGEQQVLNKMKEVLALIDEPRLAKTLQKLKKCKKIERFSDELGRLLTL